MGIGNYFVNYAIARSGDGGNREIKDDSKIEVLGEDEKIIESNRTQAKESSEKWENNIKKQSVETKANDGINLRGTEYLTNEENDNWVIIFHGYRAEPKSVLTIGEHFSEKGYNVLIPSMRACAESDGDFVGMGWLDKDDLKCWVNLILEQNSNANIILHGSSMGAATVMMVSGEDLPSNVKAVVEDCGYTSAWDQFAYQLKVLFNLPEFPMMNIANIICKIRSGYFISDASAIKQVKKSVTPTLFIHGDSDSFVPFEMQEKLYEACNAEKEKVVIEGAAHAKASSTNPELYWTSIVDFLEKYVE